MKVFLSWSGPQSREVARFLHGWLKQVIQALEPYFSEKDIAKGSRWFAEVATQLDGSDFGIVCLTPDNLGEPWLLFEAGALAKKLDEGQVTALLVGLKPEHVSGPLSQFQNTRCDKQEVEGLMNSINQRLGDRKLPQETLKASFETYWTKFEDGIANAKEIDLKLPVKPADSHEMLAEILEQSRYMSREISRVASQVEVMSYTVSSAARQPRFIVSKRGIISEIRGPHGDANSPTGHMRTGAGADLFSRIDPEEDEDDSDEKE